MRAAPDRNASEMADLVPANGQIEVLQISGDWAEISAPYGESWVETAKLIRLKPSSALPHEFSCIGVNPTWLLQRRDNSVFVDFLEGYLLTFDVVAGDATKSSLNADSPDGQLALELSRERCRLPQNEFRYGFKIDARIPDFSLTRVVTGCCSLKR